MSWLEALGEVRGWLEQRVMLRRYWKAYSDKPPQKELQMLLKWVYAGTGLYLYVG